MHSVINSIGEDIRSGKVFRSESKQTGLIEGYDCAFKTVNRNWYQPILGYATWFYKGNDFPTLQCIWPDKTHRFPWEDGFYQAWAYAQPLLFRATPEEARVEKLLKSLKKS